MTGKFKIGDLVKVVNREVTIENDNEYYYLNWIGEVVDITKPCEDVRGFYIVDFKDGAKIDLFFAEEELELAESSVDDSKKLIRRFPSGAVRSDSTGRPRPDWLSPYALEEISKVLVGNVNDFGAMNYSLGIPEEACLESLVRHVLELQEAILIKKDMEAAKVVARSVGFNVIAMLHTMVLKERGLYKEVYDKTELVTVEEAKNSNEFVK